MAPLIWIAWNQSSVSIQPSTAIRPLPCLRNSKPWTPTQRRFTSSATTHRTTVPEPFRTTWRPHASSSYSSLPMRRIWIWSNASGNSSRRKPCITDTTKRSQNSKPLVRNSSEIRANTSANCVLCWRTISNSSAEWKNEILILEEYTSGSARTRPRSGCDNSSIDSAQSESIAEHCSVWDDAAQWTGTG